MGRGLVVFAGAVSLRRASTSSGERRSGSIWNPPSLRYGVTCPPCGANREPSVGGKGVVKTKLFLALEFGSSSDGTEAVPPRMGAVGMAAGIPGT